jgi:predicted ATPase/DNA-binding CsgD family transcriptional regulator
MYTGRGRAVVPSLPFADDAPGGGCMLSPEAREPLRIAPAPSCHPAVRGATDNLPAQVNSFIGREVALAEVGALLAPSASSTNDGAPRLRRLTVSGQARLVTLTGPPGVGKTQLALHVATGQRGRFRDGVWLVELAALAEPALVPSVVAATFNLRGDEGRAPAETLAAYLRSRELLLVLDNCEHLVDACAALTATLLRACPDLRVLATSREPLGTAGELCWPVRPLSLPDTPPPRPVAPHSHHARNGVYAVHQDRVDAVLASEAGRLFVERARAVRPTLALTADAADAVASICHHLDGIPLAIELAAAWAGALSPSEIAARLDDRFTLLMRTGRTAAPHQRTLRESVDWSHALLSEPERVLLRRLAIFRGGWTLDAGSWVMEDGGTALLSSSPNTHHLSPNTLDVLASLIEKSLVVAEDRDGETRYRFLETIREYAAERLHEAGEEAAVARRHRDWYVDVAERAALHLRGPEQATWRARLEIEHDNLRAALGRTIERDEAEPGLRICIALWIFWWECGYTPEGYAWVSRLLALPSAAARTSLRAAALFVAAKLATEDPDLATALAYCEESLAIAREVGDPHTIHRTLTQLGHIERGRGRWLAARRYYEEALPLRRTLGDPVTVAVSLTCLGNVAQALREYATARAFYEEGLELARQQGHPGEITTAQHDLGRLAHEQGHDAEAAAWYAEALPVAHRINHTRRIAYLLEGCAELAVRREPERALRLVGAAAALREASGNRLPPSEQAALKRELAPARRLLGDDAMAAAWAAGTALTVEQAVALALSPPTAVTGPAHADPASRLTSREREVAALVAQGLTNRQIAETLIVSQRTAESHVANSLAKLGLATRAQLAAWATGRGLVAPDDLPTV